jgi:hypothetical protein
MMVISLVKSGSKYSPDGSGYFTRDQVDELRRMLNLDNYETASKIAKVISHKLSQCEFYAEARKEVPRDSDAKERLLKIALHAKELARLLSEESFAASLINPPERYEGVGGVWISIFLMRLGSGLKNS